MQHRIYIVFCLMLLNSTHLFSQKIGALNFQGLPQDLQLYPRENDNQSEIAFTGNVQDDNITEIAILWFRDKQLFKYNKLKLNNRKFLSSTKIKAELQEYHLEVYALKGKDSSLIVRRSNIVSGDVFYVSGQSNAWIGPIDKDYYQGEWLRSFGKIQAPENFGPYALGDTLWALNKDLARVGPFATEFGRLIIDSEKIPVAIINSAAGTSSIEWHLKLDGNLNAPDGGNILLYKALKSGVGDKAKAIIFRQGENEISTEDYGDLWKKRFLDLRGKWKTYLPKIDWVFVPQVNVLVYEKQKAGLLRESQRQLDGMPFMRSWATLGNPEILSDQLHYTNPGYRITALELARLVLKDVYKKSLGVQVQSPNPIRAYFPSSSVRNKVTIEFEEGQNLQILQDTTITDAQGKLRTFSLKDQFFWDYYNLQSMGFGIDRVEAEKNKIHLYFKFNYDRKSIGYLPAYHLNYQDKKSEFSFPGPFIKNEIGMRAFAFSNMPIEESGNTSLEFNVFPNPSDNQYNLQWRAPIKGDVLIYNFMGKLVWELRNYQGIKLSLTLGHNPPGKYLLYFKSSTGEEYQKSLILSY